MVSFLKAANHGHPLFTVKLFRNDCGSCYTIGIATLSDWLQWLALVFQPVRSKINHSLQVSPSWRITIDQLKRHKKKKSIDKTKFWQPCQRRMISSLKSHFFILGSPWQLSIRWNRENNNLPLFLEPQPITPVEIGWTKLILWFFDGHLKTKLSWVVSFPACRRLFWFKFAHWNCTPFLWLKWSVHVQFLLTIQTAQ